MNSTNLNILPYIIPETRFGKMYRRSYVLKGSPETEYLSLTSELLSTDEVNSLAKNLQHSDITVLEHVRSVSFLSYKVCKKLGWDYESAAKAGLLHDLVFYDWHDNDKSHRLHGFRHPSFALANARNLTDLNPLEENIILRHMWPLTLTPPKYKEAFVVSMMDKYCATKETLRKYRRNPEVLRRHD